MVSGFEKCEKNKGFHKRSKYFPSKKEFCQSPFFKYQRNGGSDRSSSVKGDITPFNK